MTTSDESMESLERSIIASENCQSISMEKTHFGVPVVIETLSEELSSLSLPKTLAKMKCGVETTDDTLHKDKLHIDNIKTQVVVAESIEISESSNAQQLQDQNDSKLEIQNNVDELESNIKYVNDNVQFYSIRNNVFVIMRKDFGFSFTGKLTIKVLYGTVDVYGFILTTSNNSVDIYSPKGYNSVSIENHSTNMCNDNSDGLQTIKDIETKNQIKLNIDKFEPGYAIIVLTRLENNLTRFINAFSRFKVFPHIKNTYSSWRNLRRAEAILQCNFCIPNDKQLIFDEKIADLADRILNRWKSGNFSCALIAGGKNAGKSTTVRYLINRLLSTTDKVVLIDFDPGQAECTPAACISYSIIEEPLLGPNFTHLKSPAYQIYIGDINVTSCLAIYIKSVKLLVSKLLDSSLASLPIIVNTMGFTHGIGWDIIIFIIRLLRPSFVLQIQSKNMNHNFRELLSDEVVNRQRTMWIDRTNDTLCYELLVLNSTAQKDSEDTLNLEPYQKRELVMTAYLSQIIKGNKQYFSINEVVPYLTPFSALYIVLPNSVPASQALIVINGNMVALCGVDMPNSQEQEQYFHGPRILTRLPLCTCYGFGVVRGIDMERKEIFINTPIPDFIMRYVNCLVGGIPMPQALLQFNQSGVRPPYAGGIDALPTSRDPRRGYFHYKYRNRRTSN